MMKMSECTRYNPDNVFGRFKLIEFPISFVGLSTTQIIDVDINLTKSAYLKTLCEGRLQKFEEAREISASHRAFEIIQVNENKLQIKYLPKNECISISKRKNLICNRFVFDLHLMQINEPRCCSNELHAEIGRFYISGEYEYCNFTHHPKIIDFGDINIKELVTRYVRMRNESKLVAAFIQYDKVNSIRIRPQEFILLPNSSIRLAISIRPPALKISTTLTFKIRNRHYRFDSHMKATADDENFITYTIPTKINILYPKLKDDIKTESLHKLYDPTSKYTYLGEELEIHNKRKTAALKYLCMCKCIKCTYPKRSRTEKITIGKDICYPDLLSDIGKLDGRDFCKIVENKISIYDLSDILFLPLFIDFGKVALTTYGKQEVTIWNKTKCTITIRLCPNDGIVYSEKKLSSILFEIESFTKSEVTVFCVGLIEGRYEGTFEYLIDDIYRVKHMYVLVVANPTLTIIEKSLKFGMVTNETFITSVPIRIFNHFNNVSNFTWENIHHETPFEIIPKSGCIPANSCRICDIIYICKPTKTKIHEINFITNNLKTKSIPIELNIITRKLSIKFLQPAVIFKDIPLNLETIEKVKLENSSRELALFHVVEPLLPGFKIKPMSGTIYPKMIMTFDIIVKVPCILEFNFDIFVKINYKEMLSLPISGIVVEPRIIIHPKNIYMPRIPCHLISFVPVTLQNISSLKTEVDILDTADDNIFDVYTLNGNEKEKVYNFIVEGGQSKTVYIKVSDTFRREYEMYIPFKINGLLGPPNGITGSTELQYYISEYEQYYEHNSKVKLKNVNKDISYCRITGVITVPWVTFSVNNFEFDYKPCGISMIEFSITNVSKYYLFVTILTANLAPNFTLKLLTMNQRDTINEAQIKFELDRRQEVLFSVEFHPKDHGRFMTTATLFLDKHMTIPYSNLTFFGKRETPAMIPSTYRVIFPACNVRTTITRVISIKFEGESDLNPFSCIPKEGSNLIVKFVDYKTENKNKKVHTILSVELSIYSESAYIGNTKLHFEYNNESSCEIDVYYCVTYCPLTLHANYFVDSANNPYPYYPLSTQADLFNYLEECVIFLEKWMFQQGFRRDLYPIIPDTFHTISSPSLSQVSAKTGKGINVSYLNFVRRIAGPLLKHVRKITVHGVDNSFKYIQEVHETYRSIIILLKSRGANLWVIQARFLLSHEQFTIFSENVTAKSNADIILTKILTRDIDLFNRLNKQSWMDFILQTYKVFILDSCFFDCVCVSTMPRDIIKILIDWYNEQIHSQQTRLLGLSSNKTIKSIQNLTTDLTDGIALVSAITNYCPFLNEHFSFFCEVNEENKEGDVINNACLIIEAMNQLRLYFPLSSRDFLKPNFLQMLFLSIHLYVVLPMFKPKETITLNPPLLRSSTRQISIYPSSQEALMFSYVVLNNNRNSFFVEKVPPTDSGKKMFVSVMYNANFIDDEECLLLLHGYNKTRIFDTYITFILQGRISALNPERKCKLTGPLYRPMKVDIMIASPFPVSALFSISITDVEPTLPVQFNELKKPRFYIRRLNLIDKDIYLSGCPKETTQDLQEHKVYLQIICLSTQVGNSWIWFRSDIGQFFVRVTTQPRWDLVIDTLQTKVNTWPLDPCSCGEACECYRTCSIMIPHRNELMLKALRYALMENASTIMMNVFDKLVETTTGKLIIDMLLEEGGTNMSEVQHILRNDITYHITSRTLLPRLDHVTLTQHTNEILALPVTIPTNDNMGKYTITFTSECGMDIRTYRIFFIEETNESS